MSSILGQRLLESEYGKKLINMDLVKKIESYSDISFNNNEREIIEKIIKTSPGALIEAYKRTENEIYTKDEYANGYRGVKECFIFTLVSKFGFDLEFSGLPCLYITCPFKYEITLTFKPEEGLEYMGEDPLPYEHRIEKNRIKTVHNASDATPVASHCFIEKKNL